MIKKLTVIWLQKKGACREAIKAFKAQNETDPIALLKLMLTKRVRKKYRYLVFWFDWLIVRLMNYKQYVSYAIYAAEQALDIFENKYPDDKKPRLAIEAAKKCLVKASKKNKAAAAAAAATALNAAPAYPAYAAYAAVYAAAAAAGAPAYVPAYADTYDAAVYADHTDAAMKIKIAKYGIKLLE